MNNKPNTVSVSCTAELNTFANAQFAESKTAVASEITVADAASIPEQHELERTVFMCDRCGSCCRHLNLFGPSYAWLDRGDGVCRNLDPETNLCLIYNNRPLICNVKEGYKSFFSDISYERYIAMTMQGCLKLKQIDRDERISKKAEDKV